jgi:hypothetical protein
MNRVILEMFMQGRSSISLAEFSNIFFAIFKEDVFLDPSQDDDIKSQWTIQEIKSFIKTSYKQLVLKHAIGCQCLHSKGSIPFNPDPFDQVHVAVTQEIKNQQGSVRFVYKDYDLIDSYAPNDNTFYVVSSDLHTVDEIYFEFNKEPVQLLDLSQNGSYAVTSEFLNQYKTDLTKNKIKHDLFINFLHLKTNENSAISVDLQKVFNEFPVDSASPFMRYHKNGRTLFKIHKPTS